MPYDIAATVDIETAYLNSHTSVDLSTTPANIPYTIDFTLSQQTRHHYNTRRQIKRIPLPKPLLSYLVPQQPSFSLAAPAPAAIPSPHSANYLSPVTSILSSGATPSGSSPRGSKASKTKSASSKKTGTRAVSSRSAPQATAAPADPLGPLDKFAKKVTSLKDDGVSGTSSLQILLLHHSSRVRYA